MEDNQKRYNLCDICKSEANCICWECKYNYFCDSCYKMIHSIKELSRHKKEKIDNNVPLNTICSEHNNNPLNLFCVDEKGNNIYI